LGAIFTRIDHARTADEVVQQIEDLVLEGVLRAGDRLPGERDLSRQFDVSRPILREALRRVEARGLTVTRHGGGTYVADVVGQIFSAPVLELFGSHPRAKVDYLEYRRDMEGMAAEYAARRVTADDRALLDRIVTRMSDAHQRGDFDEEASIDVEFHNAIGECAHNIILLHTLRSCYRLLSDGVFQNRVALFTLPGARDQLLEQHLAIHRAVVDGDATAARRAAMDHMTFVEQAMTQAERSGDWQRIARLRRRQRLETDADDGDSLDNASQEPACPAPQGPTAGA
jgi:GntR family transcriptional repressor for pyruvate dehydrogenase complex